MAIIEMRIVTQGLELRVICILRFWDSQEIIVLVAKVPSSYTSFCTCIMCAVIVPHVSMYQMPAPSFHRSAYKSNRIRMSGMT